jgi:spermidine synthase
MNKALPSTPHIRVESAKFQPQFSAMGIDTERVLSLFTTRRDWNPKARVLTDQYSPANLLNR